MTKWNIYITIGILFISCSTLDKDKSGSYDIKGKWKSENFQARIHSVFDVLRTESNLLHKHRIDPGFELEIKPDMSFQLKADYGFPKNGVIELKNDTIILRLNDQDFDWIILEIDSFSQEYLFTSSDKVLFHWQNGKDSLTFFTGEEVQFKLKKI